MGPFFGGITTQNITMHINYYFPRFRMIWTKIDHTGLSLSILIFFITIYDSLERASKDLLVGPNFTLFIIHARVATLMKMKGSIVLLIHGIGGSRLMLL